MRCQCKKKIRTFYWYFRPIAIIAKLFGVLPLQNLYYGDGSKIYFSYISVAHLYSTVVFIAVLSLFAFFSQFQFSFPKDQPIIIWKTAVTYVMIIRSALCFLFCVVYSKKLPNLIKMLIMFDKNKCCILNTTESKMKSFFKRAVFPLFHGAFCMIISYTELRLFILQILTPETVHSKKGQIAAIIFGILGDWQLLPVLLYIYFAFVIRANFKSINDTISSYVSAENIGSENIQYDPNLSKIIENIRCLHTVNSAAVNQLSESYGSFMAVDRFCINIMFVVNCYVYFLSKLSDFHLLLVTLINGILIVVVIMISHSVKDHATRILDTLQYISLSILDEASRVEIQLFMTQLASRPIEISAAGYFVMDRSQIPSILSSVATYLIVLIQFTQSPISSVGSNCSNFIKDS